MFQNTSETHHTEIDLQSLSADLVQIWDQTRQALKADIGEQAFKVWIVHLRVSINKQNEVFVFAPNVFLRDWVQTHYGMQIRKYWKKYSEKHWKKQSTKIHGNSDNLLNLTFSVQSLVKGSAKKALKQEAINSSVLSGEDRSSQKESSLPGRDTYRQPSSSHFSIQSGFGSSLQKAMTFENFIIGDANEVPCAVARRVSRGGDNEFNPVYIYGAYGCGKTHLLNSVAHEARRLNPDRCVLYMTAERFLNSFIKAVRSGQMSGFKDQLRNVDLFLLDDIHTLSGKTSTQEEFMHTLVALLDRGHQVVLSADRPATALESIDNRLRSYLCGGLSCDVIKPDLDLRRKMLDARIDILATGAYPGLGISEEVRDFLAARVTGSPRELFGALNRIIARTAMLGREVTLQAVQDSLSDYVHAEYKRITVDDIQKTVAEYYNLCVSDLLSSRRSRSIARPRQIAMYLAKTLTTRSLPDLGRRFGGRDHTTVIHAIRKVESLSQSDEGISADIDLLKARLTKP